MEYLERIDDFVPPQSYVYLDFNAKEYGNINIHHPTRIYKTAIYD